ncbi:MAG TPA: RHS repeat-associated core domain-containing protein, partial [Acidimicrobiales bacterium]
MSESVKSYGDNPASKRHSYDYDSRGDRQGQQSDSATGSRYPAYAKDANGSVVGLEKDDGTIAADDRYDYDPYGELDRKLPAGADADDPDAGLSGEAKDNPFRFEGFYYDSGVKTYDMHARQYRPEVGRFLSRDVYASAAGDQALQADPLTQNRYAFAGANPVTNIEFDGHRTCEGGEPEACAKRDRRTTRAQGRHQQQQDREQAREDQRATQTHIQHRYREAVRLFQADLRRDRAVPGRPPG